MRGVVLTVAAALAATLGMVHATHGGQPRETPGELRGRLHLRPDATPAARRPALVEPPIEQGGRQPPRPSPGVVYLETAPQSAFDDVEPGRARLDQRDETFVPHVLAIRVGTVVDFPNNDRTYHNVFSLSKTRRFDLGRYSAGHSRAVRFDRPGIVRVFCDIHSHMHAFILVFSHRFFAVTEPDGRFDLGRVPPGTYQLAAWHEGAVRVTRTVTVNSGAATVVDLEVP